MKYAISIKLSELGYTPYIIGTFYDLNSDISFIKRNTNLIIINNFSEIKPNDYEILMVNSDQTWRKKYISIFYDFAFLCFARNWKKYKFIYGASLGSALWKLNKTDEKIAKICLKDFKGISVREIGAVNRIEKHLGIKPKFVLDPTFLINEKEYLNIINDYKNINHLNNDYIFTYLFSEEKEIVKFIKDSSVQLNYSVHKVKKYHLNSIKKFIYGIYNCKAVITNSYHGTIFSIIFKKTFITFIYKDGNNDRFDSLKEILHIGNRIVEYNKKPNISLLTTPLNINQSYIESLKIQSIDYIKKNLNDYKKENNYF